jgi:hypothetical protein
LTNSSFQAAFDCWEQGNLPGAAAIYRSIIAVNPQSADAHAFLGQTLLAMGDFEYGLAEHEWRPEQRRLPWPRWRGEPLAGRTLFFHGEQGFGDNIQFLRFAKPLADRGARVIVATREGLRRLFLTCPGVADLIEPGQPVGAIDFELPMFSAPFALGTRIETIPADIPYLQPDPARQEHWSERLKSYRGRKIGLVWAGNPNFAHDARRSPGLGPFLPLLDIPDATFFSLQIGPPREQLKTIRPPANFVDLGDAIASFDDSAAIMANLDLIISSCTAPAHLAGALGRPVWIALTNVADWRWFRDREDSPWYPTARLFRQARTGDWSPVFARMRQALTAG